MYERYTYSYMYKGGEMRIGVLYIFVYICMYVCNKGCEMRVLLCCIYVYKCIHVWFRVVR